MNFRYSFLCLFACIPLLFIQAQQAVGEWQTYLSYHNATRCEAVGSKLFILANGGLYSYDKEDASIRTYYKTAPLSDTDISYIAYQPNYKALVIVYSNANIDLLIEEENIYNLPDYKNKNLAQNKSVHHACFNKEFTYLSTASGILCINLKKKEISNYYSLNKEVIACNVLKDQLFAATSEGLYVGLLTDNLLDSNNWKKVSEDTSEFLSHYGDIPFKENVPVNNTPNSPIRNLPFYMNFAHERLLVTGGGHIADRLNHPGTIMTFENNTWNHFQETGISEQTHQSYRDINCIAQDPQDDTHHFAASAGEGIYEFKNGKIIQWYSLHNSPLESALPNEAWKANYVRINGLIYDKENNLWMVNCETTHAVHVLKKNKEWVSYYYPELMKASNFGRTLFDRRGWLWATSARVESGGIFCLNAQGTIDNSTDDQHIFISRFTNQDGILLEQLAVYCMAEDKEGVMWLGTNKGPIILNNPSRIFQSNFNCTQLKIPRNDGSNLADFLLNNELINAIAIDGANRKWIGTESNGVYLLSADGLKTIHHFTAENSPLLSNSIYSIAIQPRTGEVFIGTSNGLVSYQSDATEAANSFQEENIHAYPNPVKPDYNGIITVTGMVYDSDVKIVDAAGQLIYQAASLGGQFTWNGKNRQGRRVATGIYMVLAADKEGKEGIVAKIAFIR